MLTNTFQHLPGIGPQREQNCWNNDITTWNDYIHTNTIKGISNGHHLYHIYKLTKARKALNNNNYTYFHTIPQSLTWRLYPLFHEQALYLDIETNAYQQITVIGVHGTTTRQYVQGKNLTRENIKHELNHKALLITYNGTSWDIPKLTEQLNLTIQTPHLDIAALAQQNKQTYSLTTLENKHDITRHINTNPINAWQHYIRYNDDNALKQLLSYNQDDVANLKPLTQLLVQDTINRLEPPFFIQSNSFTARSTSSQ